MTSPDSRGLGPLLERTFAGDARARHELFGHLRAYLKALVRSWLGGQLARELDASDLAQESLLRIDKGWDGLRGRTVPELLGWVRAVARHLTVDHLRQLAGAREVATPAEQIPGEEPSPLDAIIDAEGAVRVAAALEQLPDSRRDVIQMRLIDGLSFAEIAERTGKNSGALRVLFMRALEQLRHMLEDER